jgi:hypothetical protein
MTMNAYPGQPLSSSSLYGGSALITVGQSIHDLGPSGPPSDHLTLYIGSGVTQSPPQGSQAMPDTTGQSVYSTRPSSPFANRLTTHVGPSGILVATCDRTSAEGWHKDSRPRELHDKYLDDSSSGDESKKLHVAELVWLAKAKSSARSHLHSAQKGKVKSTFNVVKYDKLFDELLKNGNIKLSHTILLIEELKRRVYCKWHDSFLHNTNDCNVFCRQIQSAINEGRSRFQEMKIDRPHVLVNTLKPTRKNVLVRPCVTDKGKGKNIIIGDPRTPNISHRVVTRKAPENRKTGGARGQAQSNT